jgi:hypothetical protein
VPETQQPRSQKAYHALPIAVDSLGTFNSKALDFSAGLGRRVTENSTDSRMTLFQFQRISGLILHCNSVAFRIQWPFGGPSRLEADRGTVTCI